MASMKEVAGYAYAAGLRNPAKLTMAVAIAWAESGGNVRAFNPNGRDRSYGLWQINMKARTPADLGIPSEEALYDPVVNARAMVKISNSGANWKPWSTYPLRAAAFVPAADIAVGLFLANPSQAGEVVYNGVNEAAAATGVDSLAQAVSEAVQTPTRVLNWLTEPGTWIRISLFALGGAMVIGGVMIFARPATESAAGAVAKVLPVGKAASLVKGAA